eukprot:3649401-Amphidinium_carterae.1
MPPVNKCQHSRTNAHHLDNCEAKSRMQIERACSSQERQAFPDNSLDNGTVDKSSRRNKVLLLPHALHFRGFPF